MSLPNTKVRKRRPTHPGDMLRLDFLPDVGMTVAELALAIGVSRQSVNELVRARRALTPDMALRLSRLFGNRPEFWLDAQRAVDLWDAEQLGKAALARIVPLTVSGRQASHIPAVVADSGPAPSSTSACAAISTGHPAISRRIRPASPAKSARLTSSKPGKSPATA